MSEENFNPNFRFNYLGNRIMQYYDHQIMGGGIELKLTELGKKVTSFKPNDMPLRILITNPRHWDFYDLNDIKKLFNCRPIQRKKLLQLMKRGESKMINQTPNKLGWIKTAKLKWKHSRYKNVFLLKQQGSGVLNPYLLYIGVDEGRYFYPQKEIRFINNQLDALLIAKKHNQRGESKMMNDL